MKKTKTLSFTRQFLIIFAVLLFMTNFVLGVVLMKQSTDIIQQLVRKNMLNLSNTAADLLDGDALEALTAEDVGSEPYNEIYDALTSFQNNIDIEYIYAVRQVGEDEFIFTVDPDPVDPGEFGEEVLVTDALRSAAKGVAMVDNAPAEDEWGNFYSSYSPVFDSKGKVAGIVGIDFNSDWYDMQIREHTVSIFINTMVSIAVGALIVIFLTNSLRKRFDTLSNELAVLSSDVDALTEEITSRRDYRENIGNNKEAEENEAQPSNDEIELLGSKLHSMHTELDRYLAFIRNKANTDALTLVNNTNAYTERQSRIEEEIATKSASFSLAVFDINDLKGINDRYGHHCGDLIIKAAADAISSVFKLEDVYRIGGDEFTVIEENTSLEEVNKKIELVNAEVDAYNSSEKENEGVLKLSIGTTAYDPEHDKTFRDTFNRADDSMYSNKKAYYEHFHKYRSTDR